MTPMLELQNVCFSYHSKSGETYALSDLSFQVFPSEFIAVTGPSGCGKSTLLSLISGLLEPVSGSILFHGQTDKSRIGYMLQKDQLLEWRSIYRNVTLGLEIQHRLDESARARVDQMLKDYGLEQFRDAHPSELSGGMRQRAALIRTLAPDPELLLLDEPFSALDYQTRLHLSDEVSAIIRREGKTALLVTHDLSEAISMADRIIVLSARPARIRAILKLHFAQEEAACTQDEAARAEPLYTADASSGKSGRAEPLYTADASDGAVHRRLTPFERRSAPEFQGYFNLLWKELNEDGTQ